jgi:secreted trypsin-like serine protease
MKQTLLNLTLRLAALSLCLPLINSCGSQPIASVNTEATSSTELIVGGRPARAGQYPFMVGLVRADQPDTFQAQFCGGTLINETTVLTSALCLDGETPETLEVFVGASNLQDPAGERIPVASFLVHPKFDPLTFEADIALVTLARPANLSRRDFAKLATSDAGDYERARGTVLGWGKVRNLGNRFPVDLEEATVPVESNEDCIAAYEGINLVTEGMICAGRFRRDTCGGDGGGPLLATERGQLTQIGITSWGGRFCGQRRFPGVYTRISTFATWIDENS